MRLRCPCFQNRSLLNESVPAHNVITPKCSRVPIWGPDSGPKIGPPSMSTNSWWTFQENQILVHQADPISNRFPKGCWNCPLANLPKVSLLFWPKVPQSPRGLWGRPFKWNVQKAGRQAGGARRPQGAAILLISFSCQT